MISRRQFLLGGTAITAGVALTLNGLYIEPNNIKESYHQIQTNKLDAPLRIVHLTDLHLDKDTKRDYVVQMVNNRNPDLILLTGDYLNHDEVDKPNFEKLKEFVNGLNAKQGIYACFGNWDEGLEDKLFLDTNVKALRDETITLEEDLKKITISGLDFAWYNFPKWATDKTLKTLNDEKFNILLYHSPDLIENISEFPIDLYLAGHTHGGQVNIPFIGPVYAPSKYGKKYASGMFEVDKTKLYVNRGLGMQKGLPMRLFCPPEIATFDIGKQEKLPKKEYLFPSNL